ncbi:hypothetical protein KUTeg_008615 [Tegillarca granosa]|uniref:Uncharacterized protein n=1 Tax=Tegillarca granosa TaxID=220873 RepID=A0ABQ9F9N3_TEGGR|nr:hypothetical protein KUTeg_008615 [Tegillarca granosa]
MTTEIRKYTIYCVMENVSLLNSSNHSNGPVTVKGSGRLLKTIIDISLPVILVITMIALGAALNIKNLINQLKNPLDVFVGLACQCILLPLPQYDRFVQSASCWYDSFESLFVCWTLDERGTENTLRQHCDVISNGLCSGNNWYGSKLEVAQEGTNNYQGEVTAIQTCYAVKTICRKESLLYVIGSICGMVVIVLITVFIGVQNRRVFFTTWKPFVASIVTPFCAFLIGYICSYISCLGHRKSKTIAIETGIQNFPLCMTVLSLSFPTKLFVVLSVYPLLYGIVSVVDGLTIVIAQKIINAAIKTYKKTSINDEAKEMEVLNQDSSKEKDTNISTPFRL